MAKKPSQAALLAQKTRKQKMILLALAPVFLALLAWQGPKTYKALMGGSPPPPAPVVAPTTPGPTGTSTTPGAPGELPDSTPGAPGVLPDSDPQPSLLDGQLLSFSRFNGRDPFVAPPSADDGDNEPASAGGATVEVNGTAEDLSAGDQFPAGDPTFVLISIGSQSAEIGLVSGTFSNGDETVTINVGETLVLQADDGASYAIKLVSVAA
jgi:hypothetical protein